VSRQQEALGLPQTEPNPLGFFSWFGYRLPFAERLRAVGAAGYSRISVWLGPEEEMVREGRADGMARLAQEAGLEIECAHAPYTNANGIWAGSPEARCDLETCIRFCRVNAVPILVIHACEGDEPPRPGSRGLDLMQDAVKQASEASVVIAIENTRKTEALDFLLARITSPHLGFCYDSSHDFLHSRKPGEILSKWGNRLVYTHFADNDGKADRHWIPGTGIGDWEAVQRHFPRSYEGPLCLEIVPKDAAAEPLPEFLAEAMRASLRLRASLIR
jgi:sugar phosphate isomerase/epimerase